MKSPKEIKKKTLKQVLKHAEEGYPNEICGVVVLVDGKEEYFRCENISDTPDSNFKINPDDILEAGEHGDIIGIVHSHPDGTSRPSSMDIAVMSAHRATELIVDPDSSPTPWHIVSWPEGDYRMVLPDESNSLLGRPFVHGIWDCWQVCNDYYNKYHGIRFQPFEREDGWWESKENSSLYEEQFEKAGFYLVDDPEVGDMIVMQIGRSYHPNHAAIYLGSTESFEGQDLVGGPFILHHMYDRKSDIVVYGGQWKQRTRMILRHREV